MWYCLYNDPVVGGHSDKPGIIKARTKEELDQIVGLSGIRYEIRRWEMLCLII
jgi:hypothetical protein